MALRLLAGSWTVCSMISRWPGLAGESISDLVEAPIRLQSTKLLRVAGLLCVAGWLVCYATSVVYLPRVAGWLVC